MTVDALVIGVTGSLAHPDALVLARPDAAGVLHAVGLSVSLPRAVRGALVGRLRGAGEPRRLPGLIGGLPGHSGASYLPVQPIVTVEVEADPLVEFGRFRHRPRPLRVHPDPPSTTSYRSSAAP